MTQRTRRSSIADLIMFPVLVLGRALATSCSHANRANRRLNVDVIRTPRSSPTTTGNWRASYIESHKSELSTVEMNTTTIEINGSTDPAVARSCVQEISMRQDWLYVRSSWSWSWSLALWSHDAQQYCTKCGHDGCCIVCGSCKPITPSVLYIWVLNKFVKHIRNLI
jgi:hypothetical protein